MSSGDKHLQGTADNSGSEQSQNPSQQSFDLPLESSHIHERGGANKEASLGVDQSLVPDLMKVYENMAVSKTPQTRSSFHALHESAIGNDVDVAHAVMEPLPFNSMGPTVPQPWSYGNLTIPAPYPVPCDHTTPMAQQDTTDLASSIQPDSSSSTELKSSGRKRSQDSRSSSSAKRRKKSTKEKKDQDGRWTKRFTWPEELHRDFVSAIFEIGLKHATPSSVLEQMPPLEQITTERIKSHLQKYRLHRRKSKQEFMSCYEETIERLKVNGSRGITSLSGGQAAAYVTHSVVTQPDVEGPAASEDPGKIMQMTSNPLSHLEGVQDGDTILTLPRLTEDEKKSPVGTSLGYLLGLFFSLKRQLHEHRNPKMTSQLADNIHSAATVTQGSASRSNLEAGSLMKREMESQMAFQNKMRALKQEELCKLAEVPSHSEGGTKQPAFHEVPSPMDHQRPGEAAESQHPTNKNRSASEDDEFWNTTPFDGELFDFLMD